MKLPFGEFHSIVAKRASLALRKAVSTALRRYKDDHRHKGMAASFETDEEFYEDFFEAVKQSTGRQRQASPKDRPSSEPFTQLLSSWSVDRGDGDLAIATYYHLYFAVEDQSYARDIDVAVFGEQYFAADPPHPGSRVVLSTSMLPKMKGSFVGRQEELLLLSESLESPNIRVVQIVAPGGFGKTSLITRFLAHLAALNYGGVKSVFEWTFYRPGNPEADAFSDDFFEQAERFFQLEPSPIKSPTMRGHRLAATVGASCTVLVLDGLEPLQYGPGARQRGQIKDLSIDALLRDLARRSSGLCIVTTRIPIDGLGAFEGKTVRTVKLDNLDISAATELLRSLGVRGSGEQISCAALSVNKNPLALRLLGNWLKGEWAGDVNRYQMINFKDADADDGGHAKRLMRRYHRWLGDLHARALMLLGYFDRPARMRELVTLAEALQPSGILGDIRDVPRALRKLFDDLAELGLVHGVGGTTLVVDCHPIVREFERETASAEDHLWLSGNKALAAALLTDVPRQPEYRAEIVELYRAVDHALNAGMRRYAWNDIVVPRIWRNEYRSVPSIEEFFSTTKLDMLHEDLSRLTRFFEVPYSVAAPELDAENRRILFSQAGFLLSSVLQLHDAIEAQRAAYDLAVKLGAWVGASIAAGSSAEYCLIVGEADRARELSLAAMDANEQIEEPYSVKIRWTIAGLCAAGAIEAEVGDFSLSEKYFEKAIALNRSDLGPRYFFRASAYALLSTRLAAVEDGVWRNRVLKVNEEFNPSDVLSEALAWAGAAILDNENESKPVAYYSGLFHTILGAAQLLEAVLHGGDLEGSSQSFAVGERGFAGSGIDRMLPSSSLGLASVYRYELLRARRSKGEVLTTLFSHLDDAEHIASRGRLVRVQLQSLLERVKVNYVLSSINEEKFDYKLVETGIEIALAGKFRRMLGILEDTAESARAGKL